MDCPRTDDDARRAYWRQQMDMAYDWMMAIRDYPAAECGELPASMDAAVQGSAREVRVLFARSKHADGSDRQFYLRQGLIDAFLDVAREMNRRGWILKVEDAYRTRQVQQALVLLPAIFDTILARTTWECSGRTVGPELMYKRATALVATLPKIATHMSASAVDTSVLQADGQTEVDRGGPYLELSERTPMESPFISETARTNRREISAIWTDHGFVAYPFEFWHYSQGDAYDQYIRGTGRPARYQAIDWDPRTRSMRPLSDLLTPLVSPEHIRRAIAWAMERTNAAVSGSQ